MPRRHRTPAPTPPVARASAKQSADQSPKPTPTSTQISPSQSSKDTLKPSATTATKPSPTQSGSSTHSASQSTTKSVHQAAQPKPAADKIVKKVGVFSSRAEKDATRTLEFNLGVSFSVLGQDNKPVPIPEQDSYLEVLTKQINFDLKKRPLIFRASDSIVVQKVLMKRGCDGHPDKNTAVIHVNKHVTLSEIEAVCKGPFHQDLVSRINDKIRPEFAGKLGRSNDDVLGLLLQSEYTAKTAPADVEWSCQERPREIDILVRSLECIEHRQAEWETFLRGMNHYIASVLPLCPIADPANLKATAVVLSNYDRKCMITLKFDRPYTPPTEKWFHSLNSVLSMLFVCARQAQLSKEPNNTQLLKSWDNITKFVMTQMSEAGLNMSMFK